MKRTIITIIIIVAALGGIYYVLTKNKAKNEAEVQVVAQRNASVLVQLDTVKQQDVNLQYIANGTFIPAQEVTVSAEASGKVTRVLVDEGSRVSAGQTLAIVEGDKLNVTVANSQAEYNNAEAEVKRFESAFSSGGVTQQQVDQAKLRFENAKNALKSSKLNAGDITIRSLVSGIVNSRKIEPGTYVSPGTPAFDIVNVSTLKLRVNVDEKNVAALKVGNQIAINVSVYPDKSFTGRITFIAPKADGSLNFPVEIEVKNTSDNLLRAGMYGTASFGENANINALVVPRNAFVGSVSSNTVFVMQQDSTAKMVKITSGRNFGNDIEVLGGLKAGDKVITSGQINLLDGTKVSAIK
ncbi:efflux RND transporter periplasmic adaptor subunit [Sphingobacterium hungaricum]|uniref:Efflux transporter periplasmic adaptor subunit n=1 Tax=Sphingobacterium hungaricum TaxID=2082723 RepID=A0A928UVS5_9SPHI|nr:efflux RND transporter periplasmic adaptor subunit [Sphingobacterium hungaricum]MBE8712431.1 efflux transporter periplasmic adaptor subunit [Sphingobacterium hungaricum]